MSERTTFEVELTMNWEMLRRQKLLLLNLASFLDSRGDKPQAEMLDGLVDLLDDIQYSAERQGHPVLWLTEDDPIEDQWTWKTKRTGKRSSAKV